MNRRADGIDHIVMVEGKAVAHLATLIYNSDKDLVLVPSTQSWLCSPWSRSDLSTGLQSNRTHNTVRKVHQPAHGKAYRDLVSSPRFALHSTVMSAGIGQIVA
jgi:hypothetical protein